MFVNNLFSDKVVLVTGGGSGIGFAISRQFLQYGATVYIASRKAARLEKSLEQLREFGTCRAITLDIREPERVAEAAKQINEEAGRLDILVNNAGGQFPSPAEAISIKGWRAVIETNLNGTFFVTQAMANQFFIPQKSGTVINIIANMHRGFPGMSHTGAARAGVDNLTKTLAIEWATHKIRVNAIAPGIIKSSGLKNYPPFLLKGISDKIPMKRLGSVEEVAYLSLFLASPMAAYITGETIYMDGGQRLWGDMWEIE